MAALLKFVMAMACAVAWGAVPLAACAQEALEVVQIVPLSGPLAQAGREINAMTRATLDDYNRNAKGGVRIELKSLDDGYSAVKATQAASSAVSSAQAFLSCFGSPSCLAQQQICAKAKVPLLGPVAGSSALRGKQAWYTYAVRAPASSELLRLLGFINATGLKSVGVFIQEDGFGIDYASELDKLRDRFPDLRFVPRRFNASLPDYRRAAEELMASRPDALLLLADSQQSAALLDAWRAKAALPLVLNLAAQADAQYADRVKGHMGMAAFVTVTPSPWGSRLPAQQDYQRIAKAAGLKPSYLSFESYLNARLLIEAVKNGQVKNKTDLSRWLDAAANIDLGTGYGLNYKGERQGASHTDLAVLTPEGKFRH